MGEKWKLHLFFFARDTSFQKNDSELNVDKKGALNSGSEFSNGNWPQSLVNLARLLGYMLNQALKMRKKLELCKMSIIVHSLMDCQLLRTVS